jgi:cation:H+ antiporter
MLADHSIGLQNARQGCEDPDVTTELAVLAFLVALVATLGSSELLILGTSRLGLKLGLAAGLVGLLTALGADSPEIASAMSAIFSGAHDVGVGVVLGSNLFNLAALLGLPGLVNGRLAVRRIVPVVDGTVCLVVTLLAAGLVTGRLSAGAALIPVAIVMVVYVTLLTLRPRMIRRLHLPGHLDRTLSLLASQIHAQTMVEDHLRAVRGWLPVWLMAPALAVIVGGSVVMVTTALLLGQRWHVPPLVLGTVVLAGVTSLPNLYAAVRLGQLGEGATLVSEALNSNTLNLVAGLSLTSLIVGVNALALGAGSVSLIWLLGLSVLAIALITLRSGLTRLEGALIILGYAAFLVFLFRSVFS